jgi:hypothetical protein
VVYFGIIAGVIGILIHSPPLPAGARP